MFFDCHKVVHLIKSMILVVPSKISICLINALVVCDHEYFITYVDSKAPGACHDAGVLKNTDLYEQFEKSPSTHFQTASLEEAAVIQTTSDGFVPHFHILETLL